MFCQTCEGDSHLCADLHLHYANFSQANLPLVVGGLNPYIDNESNEIQPLCFNSYVKFIQNSRSLTKAVRSLTRHNFMKKLIAFMTTNPSNSTLANSVVMLQPSLLLTLRNFAPTDANLQKAFYQIVVSSQTYFKPHSKQFLPTKLSNGLMIASIKYDEKSA